MHCIQPHTKYKGQQMFLNLKSLERALISIKILAKAIFPLKKWSFFNAAQVVVVCKPIDRTPNNDLILGELLLFRSPIINGFYFFNAEKGKWTKKVILAKKATIFGNQEATRTSQYYKKSFYQKKFL